MIETGPENGERHERAGIHACRCQGHARHHDRGEPEPGEECRQATPAVSGAVAPAPR